MGELGDELSNKRGSTAPSEFLLYWINSEPYQARMP